MRTKALPTLLCLLAAAAPSFADHLDVIDVELRPDCAFPDYLAIVGDFNVWAEPYGYRTEIAFPLHAPELTTMKWIGRSADAATFGKAWDAWRDAQADPTSVPAKLNARFTACTQPLTARASYDTYP